jgi:hypothetical protein
VRSLFSSRILPSFFAILIAYRRPHRPRSRPCAAIACLAFTRMCSSHGRASCLPYSWLPLKTTRECLRASCIPNTTAGAKVYATVDFEASFRKICGVVWTLCTVLAAKVADNGGISMAKKDILSSYGRSHQHYRSGRHSLFSIYMLWYLEYDVFLCEARCIQTYEHRLDSIQRSLNYLLAQGY